MFPISESLTYARLAASSKAARLELVASPNVMGFAGPLLMDETSSDSLRSQSCFKCITANTFYASGQYPLAIL
jgi:hypothetical protein